METLSFFLEEEEDSKWFLWKTHKILSRVYNRKSVQLPYGFYTSHLDRMTYTISSEYAKLWKHSSKEASFCYIADVH